MKFYYQTRFGHSLKEPVELRGNCLPTCLGCFMHLEPEKVFQMQEYYQPNKPDIAHDMMDEWLHERGWKWVSIEKPLTTNHYYMATVKTDTGSIHVVICQKGRVVHDPNPTPVNIVEYLSYEILIPLKDYNEDKKTFVLR